MNDNNQEHNKSISTIPRERMEIFVAVLLLANISFIYYIIPSFQTTNGKILALVAFFIILGLPALIGIFDKIFGINGVGLYKALHPQEKEGIKLILRLLQFYECTYLLGVFMGLLFYSLCK